MMQLQNKKMLYIGEALVALMAITFFINRGMFSAFILLTVLLFSTFFVLRKYGKLTKTLAFVLGVSFLLHFCLVIFIYQTDFRPFGGGADYEGYQRIAAQTAANFWKGDFSLAGAHYGHDFPVVIAVVYAIFGSDPLVGRFLIVWFFVVSVLLVYLIVKELGGGEKRAMWVSLFMNVYPSYSYFGSILLKDTLIIPLIFLGILLVVRMVKKFYWLEYLIFFLLTVIVSYLRFYMGYALILSFVVAWFLSLASPIKKKFLWGVVLSLVLACFSPAFSGQGVFGWKVFDEFLNPGKITQYREISYNPDASGPSSPNDEVITDEDGVVRAPNGTGSSFLVETGFKDGPIAFIKNSSISFTYALLGPFVWQLRYKRQLVALIETIPWYLYILTFFYFLAGFIKKEKLAGLWQFVKKTAPLWSFAVLALASLSLFINNYGIITRIRIPILMSLIIMAALLIKKENTYLWKNT